MHPIKDRFEPDEWDLLLLLPTNALGLIAECGSGFDGSMDGFLQSFKAKLKSEGSPLHDALRTELTIDNIEDALKCSPDERAQCVNLAKELLRKRLDESEYIFFLRDFILTMAKAVSKQGVLDPEAVDGIYLLGDSLGVSEDVTRYFVTGQIPPHVNLPT